MGYKRVGSSSSIPQFNEEEGESVTVLLRKRDNTPIYFGIKKPKSATDESKSWRELTNSDFSIALTSDVDGCSAKVEKNTNDSTNKTGIITYTLSKNTTGNLRLITFKYKNTTLFKILLVPSLTDNNTYVYLRYWHNTGSYLAGYGGTDEYIVCKTSNGFTITTQIVNSNAYINYTTQDHILYHVTNNKDASSIFKNLTIKSLVTNGTLVYDSGKNFNDSTYTVIKAPTKMLVDINNLTIEDVNDDSKMYILEGFSDATAGGLSNYDLVSDTLHNTIDWSNIVDGDATSIGKYKLNIELDTLVYILYYAPVTTGSSPTFSMNRDGDKVYNINDHTDYNDAKFTYDSNWYGYVYFCPNDLSLDLTIKTCQEMLQDGTLTFVDGYNLLTANEYLKTSKLKKWPTKIYDYNTYSIRTLNLYDTIYLYLYTSSSNGGTYTRLSDKRILDFSNIKSTKNISSVGVYKYKKQSNNVTTKTSIIYLASTTISGNYYLFDNSASKTFTDANNTYTPGFSYVDNIDESSTYHRYLFYYTTDNIIISGNVSNNLSKLTKLSGTGNLSSDIYSNCLFLKISKVNVKGSTSMKDISVNDYIWIYQKTGNIYTYKDTINFSLNENTETLGKYLYTYTI